MKGTCDLDGITESLMQCQHPNKPGLTPMFNE